MSRATSVAPPSRRLSQRHLASGGGRDALRTAGETVALRGDSYLGRSLIPRMARECHLHFPAPNVLYCLPLIL